MDAITRRAVQCQTVECSKTYGESWTSMGLNFALGALHRLRHSSVFVQGGKWKAYIKACELYLIAWSVGLVDCPSLRRAAVHFDGLVLGGNEYIFLNSWAGTIQAEFSPPVVGFGGI
jgi:hypothetical protein